MILDGFCLATTMYVLLCITLQRAYPSRPPGRQCQGHHNLPRTARVDIPGLRLWPGSLPDPCGALRDVRCSEQELQQSSTRLHCFRIAPRHCYHEAYGRTEETPGEVVSFVVRTSAIEAQNDILYPKQTSP